MAGYWTGGENGEWIEDTPAAPSWLPAGQNTSGGTQPIYDGWMGDLQTQGNLTPDQLNQLSTKDFINYDPMKVGNFTVTPQINYGWGEAGADGGTISGYNVFDPSQDYHSGDYYGHYNTSGEFLGPAMDTPTSFSDWLPFLMAAGPFAAAIAGPAAGAAGAGGIGGGGGTAAGFGNGAFLGEGIASGVGAWDSAYLAAGGAFTGGGAGAGLDFSQGFTDGGTAGGALDTGYAAGSAGGTGGSISPGGGEIGTMNPLEPYTPTTPTLPDPITIPPGIPNVPGGVPGGGGDGKTGGINLGDILGLLGGAWNMNNQNNASDEMLAYLKERQGINDNMYKEGSPEFNALWDEMSRKDAAAGRNSQYGPRSVDLAARIAQIKMDANTKMTTGIGNLYRDSINQGANSPASLLAQLGSMQQGGSFDWLDDFDLSDVTDLFGGLFD